MASRYLPTLSTSAARISVSALLEASSSLVSSTIAASKPLDGDWRAREDHNSGNQNGQDRVDHGSTT
jgi:hypothetical protein